MVNQKRIFVFRQNSQKTFSADIQEEPKEAVQVGAETKESPVKSDNDPAWSDGSVVRAGRGRKRKPGTVVDLLVSSYARKRNTRCKVGAAPSPTDCNKV